MVKATATSYKPTPPGNYRAKFTKHEEKSNQDGAFWIWTFRLIEDMEGDQVDEEYEILTVSSSTAFTPKAKARKWAQSMIGRVLEDDEVLDFDDLTGKTYILAVGINENGRNTVDSITIPKRANGKSEPTQSPLSARFLELGELLGKDPKTLNTFKAWYKQTHVGKFEEQTPGAQAEIIDKMEGIAQIDPEHIPFDEDDK